MPELIDNGQAATGQAATGQAATGQAATGQAESVLIDAVPERVLAVYAHPDDPEVAIGGSVAKWVRGGALVHVCICTDGDKGSADPSIDSTELVETRRKEVDAAGRLLGVTKHYRLGYRDGEVESDERLRGRIVELVRELRPDTVVTADPTAVFFGQQYLNHRDHREAGWATLDAVSPAASNPHYFPTRGQAYAPARVLLSGTLEADGWVDITSTIDLKAESVACHESQVGEPGEWLRTVVRQRAEEAGREAGVRFAEGFRQLILA